MPPRKNQTFSHQQNIRIVTKYGEFKSPIALRREFRKHFKLSPRNFPRSDPFSRVINRFMASSDFSPSNLPGPPRTKIIEENIDTVRNMVDKKSNFSISEVSTAMNLFTGTVLKILRKTLRKYTYNPKTVQRFTDEHKLCRIQFCNLILQQNEEFCNNIMWSASKQTK